MRRKGWRAPLALSLSVALLSGCARSDALWEVVDKLCLTNYAQKRDPAPCRQVYLPNGRQQGFVVIQNPRFPYHFILVPSAPLAGIESAALQSAQQTDYFGYAWGMRTLLRHQYGAPIPDDWLGMTLNSAYGRSQNQLHIHLSCLREDVRRQLLAERPYISTRWQKLPDKLLRHTFYARKVMQPAAMGLYPIRDVAGSFQLMPAGMAHYGVAVIPTTFDGERGFILLTTREGWDSGNRASVEALLDKRCEAVPREKIDIK